MSKRATKMTPALTQSLRESVHSLDRLSVRDQNTLYSNGLHVVEDLLYACPLKAEECTRSSTGEVCRARHHLLDIPNFGKTAVASVFAALESIGFRRY